MSGLKHLIARTALLAVFAGATLCAHAGIITKGPDLGPYWQPVSGTGGTYIYSNSFVAPDNGTVSSLGLWLISVDVTGQDLVLDVFGSAGGNPANGPDTTNVIAQTGVIPGQVYGALTFVSASTISSLALNAGQVYWFAVNAVGQAPGGQYQVGGHTQNSVYNDNGTFWYSNDPAGIIYDGQSLTPEMAFQVVTGAVPEPESLALLGLGLLGLAFARKRKALRA